MTLAADAENPAATPGAAIDARRLFAPLAGALGMAAAVFWPSLMREGDTWWHLAAGEWILAHRAVPHVDPFSFSFAGQPWVAHEWLSEALMALAFRAGGWSGLALLAGLAFGATLAILARRLAAHMNEAAAALLIVLVAALLAPSLTARPHLLALPLVALWTDRLLAAREAVRAPPLALALTLMLWANLHGGFVFGLALIAPFAIEACVAAPPEARRRALTNWARFGAASLAGALATPFGVTGLLFPLKLMGLHSLGRIGEWQAPDSSGPGLLTLTLLGLFALALATSVRLGALRVALLAALAAMAIGHSRHETLLAIVGAMLLAPMLGEVSGRIVRSGQRPAPTLWAMALPIVAIIAIARIMHPIVRADDASSPIAAFAAVPDDLRGGHVLNDYDFGGFLIAHGVRPFVDGRTDLYGDAFLARFVELPTTPGALHDELEKDAIDWTIFKPDRAIVAALDREPGWRRLYADSVAVVHVRDSGVGQMPR